MILESIVIKKIHAYVLVSLVWMHANLVPFSVGVMWKCAISWLTGVVTFSRMIFPGSIPLSKCPNNNEVLCQNICREIKIVKKTYQRKYNLVINSLYKVIAFHTCSRDFHSLVALLDNLHSDDT